MDITWLGHSCFRIDGRGVSILTDPFPPGLGLPPYRETPSIVTVSNSHPNHSYTDGAQGNPRLLTRPGQYEISGAYIQAFRTSLREGDILVPRNTVFLMKIEDIVVCHLGDLGAVPTSKLMEELSQAQVLLIPAGGGCTIEVAQVVEIVHLIQPRVVIPMHYQIAGAATEMGSVDAFLGEMGARESQPVARLSLSATSLPADTRVVLMAPPGT